MVTLVKHEWHQVDCQYAMELDESLLSDIYPDLDEDEIAEKLQQIEDGEIDVEDIINDAYENDIDIDWEHQYDDNWTSRKGGYDVTYELGDENSYHHEPEPAPPTHKCTKCKWTGQSYDAEWVWPENDETGEKEAKKVCPYCESDTELTEAGKQEEIEHAERTARWNTEIDEEDEVSEEELLDALEELKAEFDALGTEQEVPCYSCGELHLESELPEMSGQYICPSCGQGWILNEFREEENEDE